jgi:hypothetical protein
MGVWLDRSSKHSGDSLNTWSLCDRMCDVMRD